MDWEAVAYFLAFWPLEIDTIKQAVSVALSAKLAKTADCTFGIATMKILSAKDAKYCFGRLIDMARAEPVLVAKHGRPVVVVMAVEEYERLKVGEDNDLTQSKTAHSTGIEEN